MNSRKLKIYLCDLTYDTIILVSDTIPINIGLIGAYLDHHLKDKVEISLFKYPNDVMEQIEKDPPDVIGFSNYSWNSNLSEFVAAFTKKIKKDTIILQGGTNFPNQPEEQAKFLKLRPSTDVYTLYEGEKAALKIIERILENWDNRENIFNDPIEGCGFIHPVTKKYIVGKFIERIKDLDELPSPYLNGMLDKFFDGRLTPFLETNRGCPFTCSFCHTGSKFYHKIHKYSETRVAKEIEYVAKKAGSLNLTNLHLADVNFGMYPTDKQTAEYLLAANKKYGWPLQIMAATGKNSKERVMEITSILGSIFSVSMSMQSMDPTVLKNIKRGNIKNESILEANIELGKQGKSSNGELIVPLPGETRETFINGLNQVLDTKPTTISIYTLMMLYGTEFKSPAYRKSFKYETKYRIVPLNFGKYKNEIIYDVEEVGVTTKDFSFDDYLYTRSMALIVETLFNNSPFGELFLYANRNGIETKEFLSVLLNNLDRAPREIIKLFNEFKKETTGELWETEEKLIKFYKIEKNYEMLKQGKIGGNLIYKYKVKGLVETLDQWIAYISQELLNMCEKKASISNSDLKDEIDNIAKFCKTKLTGLLKSNGNSRVVKEFFDYSILDWLDKEDSSPLEKFRMQIQNKKVNTIEYIFEYTDDQLRTREDYFKRYGTDINALSKIVTRVSTLESQFRKIRSPNDNHLRDIKIQRSGNNFVKYALSN
tara:strand:- start:47 stop:2179 length:2133 start_codon:yes stop_codon:yes gene_type:complete